MDPNLEERPQMVLTILEAEVDPARIGDLERAYLAESGALPPQIVESFLVRDAREETRFRIMTFWISRDALDAMRASVEKPKGVQIFEAAGALPALTVLEVVAHLRGQPGESREQG